MIEETTKIATEHYRYASNLSELDLINNEDVNIAVYQRDADSELMHYAKQLVDTGFPPLNASVRDNDFEPLFDEHFSQLSNKYSLGHQLLKSDIEELITAFFKICHTSSVKVFFGIIDTDMCRRFHIDFYELRMISTYVGQGTQWLSNDNVNFKALNNLELLEGIAKDEDKINQLEENDVAILKGALYTNTKVNGIVHKSPPIKSLGQKRLMLRVDCNSLMDCM